MSCPCDCCSGVQVVTSRAEENRPGLPRISHRPGCHATFVGAMQARLSSTDYPALAALKTRAPDDASMALCDAWAVAADVLSFYQDRVANEGYLRTATERRSVLELGRLTGYALRPGVAASIYLAYDLDANAGNVTIPVGTRAQSVPDAGEKMQTFETSEALEARAAWSQIKVRLSQPLWRSPQDDDEVYGVLATGLAFKGTATQLKLDDALLIDYGRGRQPVPYRVALVTSDDVAQITRVKLRAWDRANGANAPAAVVMKPTALRAAGLVEQLERPLSGQPRNATRVARDVAGTLVRGSEIYSRLLTRRSPALRDMLIPALRSFAAAGTTRSPIKVYALRSKAGLFGSAAPSRVVTVLGDGTNPVFGDLSPGLAWANLPEIAGRGERAAGQLVDLTHLPLDGSFEAIKPGSGIAPAYALVDFTAATGFEKLGTSVVTLAGNDTVSMSIGAAITARVSTLVTDQVWLKLPVAALHVELGSGFAPLLRRTQVYAQSELLELARDPLDAAVAGRDGELELDAYYDGLKPGMWVIAAGERADIDDPTIKVPAAERAMIAAVRHDVARIPAAAADSDGALPLPGDTLHTFVKLAAALAYTYRRSTFTLYGNVVRATHGETHREPLGGGDATRTFQRFTLKSPPLTWVAAPTPGGVASTLQVRVNQLLWQASADLAEASADARLYAIQRDDDEVTTVQFGDGVHGARLPSGPDNVAAVYRSGIGPMGNVRAGQVTLASDKPLGVKGVLNPLRASGGADPDTLEQARVNAPLAVTTLDRLVSVQDYTDFAQGFAGIGKAAAILLHDDRKSTVHVTVAGIEDEPIDETSELFLNLVDVLRRYGDPHLAVRVQVRDVLYLVLQARVAIDPAYAWEEVQPRIRAALLGAFGFAASGLGQPVFKSAILATIEAVRGVEHVSGLTMSALDAARLIDGIDAARPPAQDAGDGQGSDGKTGAGTSGATGTERRSPWIDVAAAGIGMDGKFVAAQIAYLPADVADCLILELAS